MKHKRGARLYGVYFWDCVQGSEEWYIFMYRSFLSNTDYLNVPPPTKKNQHLAGMVCRYGPPTPVPPLLLAPLYIYYTRIYTYSIDK